MLKRKERETDITNTVIGEGIAVEAGKIWGRGSVRIDGKFSGSIDITGELILGETGIIDGDIRAGKMLLAGKVTGTVGCEGLLHADQTATIIGDVSACSIMVDEGAVLNGHCKMNAKGLESELIYEEDIAAAGQEFL